MKKLPIFIICFLFAFFFFSYAAPNKLDFGLQVISKEDDYTVMYVRYPFYSSTITLKGEFPEEVEIPKLKHKRYDKYNELSDDEKLVYDAILNRTVEIFKGENYSLQVRIPVDSFLEKVDIRTMRSSVEERINNIDFEKVFEALRADYNWLFWFEENMNWTLYSPDIRFEGNNLEGSSFIIDIEPLAEYKGEGELNEKAKELVKEAREKMKGTVDELLGMNTSDQLAELRKKIIDDIEYDNGAKGYITSGVQRDGLMSAISVIHYLTDDSPKMVCEGYSNAFQMYCDALGIESYTKTGIMNTAEGNENHAWNIVYIDDTPKLVDLTNSDSGTIGYKGDLFLKDIEGEEYSFKISGYRINYQEKNNMYIKG